MNSTETLREIAEKVYPVYDVNINGIYFSSRQLRLREQFLSDLTAIISEHYTEKAKYDEAVQQRDELKEALIDMVWQFAYEGTKNGEGVMHTGGLSALEGAFFALGISDPITVFDFEAAIKSTDTSTEKSNNSKMENHRTLTDTEIMEIFNNGEPLCKQLHNEQQMWRDIQEKEKEQ